MASNARFEIHGFNELIATLKELGGTKLAKKANRRAVNLATSPILAAARSNCPVDNGDLKAAMTKKVKTEGYMVQGIVGADRDYVGENGEKPSHYDFLVEYGHEEAGTTVAPHPFLRPAWDETVSNAQERYAQILLEEIEKAAAEGKK